jgi:hypothetical protein
MSSTAGRQPERPMTPDLADTDAEVRNERVRTDDEVAAPLFADDTSETFWRRWDAIQANFVDEPRRAVEDADGLVADAMKNLADSFAQARARLEEQWTRGDNVSTEDLRVALRHYRSFFKRLLSV